MNLAHTERQAFAAALQDAGPDAPTLCDGWRARDLAAHVVIRDRRPDTLPGMFAPLTRLTQHTNTVQERVAAGAWSELLADVASGPPRWNPTRLGPINEAVNLVEFFIHTEDVRRAQPGWQPRPISGELSAELWRAVRRLGRVTLRQLSVGVELLAPVLGRATLKRGPEAVTLHGPPGELLLFVAGRRAAAQVELTGSEQGVAEILQTPGAL